MASHSPFPFLLLLLLLVTACITSAECPTGWTQSQTFPGKCYLINTHNENSVEAAGAWCLTQDPRATLLTIQNAFENTEIYHSMTFDVLGIWLGLQWNGSTWYWSNGENLTYTNWARDEPQFFHASFMWFTGQWYGYPDEPDDYLNPRCQLYY